ncbi:MAG: hypothetical protein AAF196_19990 [Planctomycetota bacterium]
MSKEDEVRRAHQFASRISLLERLIAEHLRSLDSLTYLVKARNALRDQRPTAWIEAIAHLPIEIAQQLETPQVIETPPRGNPTNRADTN